MPQENSMLRAFSFVLAVALPFAAVAGDGPLKPGFREVKLNPDAPSQQEEVRGAPFTLTALVFPEAFTQASCGNCTEKTGVQPENWFMQTASSENTIYLKPTRLPDGAHPPAAFRTTLHITLASGYRVNINLALADIAGTTHPDAEVAFTLPAKATLAGRLAEEMARKESEFKDRLDTESVQRLLDTLLGELRCHSRSDQQVSDKVYVRLVQTCTVDSLPPSVWAVFEVRNRSSGQIALGSANLLEASGASAESKHAFRLERTALRFDERTRGIAITTLAPDQPLPSAWSLEVVEDGGKARHVTVPSFAP
jgi:hypothetical protein